MNQKMRVGRRKADGSWSGIIGKFLRSRLGQADAQDVNAHGRQSGAPGEGTMLKRERCLRVLSRVAEEAKIEWIHQLDADHWIKAFNIVKAEALKDTRVKNSLSLWTISGHAASFNVFATYACEQGAISMATRKRIRDALPKNVRPVKKFLVLKKTDWVGLLREARSRHLVEYVFLAILLFAGLRSSDIRRLQWGNCHFGEKPYIEYSRDKNKGTMHKVAMNRNLVLILREWQEWLKRTRNVVTIPEDWYVVPKRPKGQGKAGTKMHPEWPVTPKEPLHSRSATEWAKIACRAIGVKDEDMLNQACHIYRRSGGDAIYRATKDVRVVSQWYGHGTPDNPNIEMTTRYLGHGTTEDDMREAVESMLIDLEEVLALPAGSEPIDGELEPQFHSPEEWLKQLKSHAMYDELVRRHGAEKVLCQAVWRTAHMSMEQQIAKVEAYRESYDLMNDTLQELALTA